MNGCGCVSIKLLFTNPGKKLTVHRLLAAVLDHQNLKLCSSKNTVKTRQAITAKETIDERKRQHTEWKKIFANDMTDKA